MMEIQSISHSRLRTVTRYLITTFRLSQMHR